MQIDPTSLTKFILTEEEEIRGKMLNHEQIAVLQNKVAILSEERIKLPFSPNNVNSYIQRESELMGQILILQQIIDDSKDAANIINTLAARQSQQ